MAKRQRRPRCNDRYGCKVKEKHLADYRIMTGAEAIDLCEASFRIHTSGDHPALLIGVYGDTQ